MTAAQRTRLGASAGVLGVITVSVASVIAALAYTGSSGEGYSTLNHWISELGEPGVSGLATVFNLGVVVGGAAFAVFMALLAASSAGRARCLWGPVGVGAGTAGLLVGVFPMTSGPAHALAAMAFFGLGGLAVGTATVDLLRRGDRRFPRWLGAVAALTIIALAGFLASLGIDPVVADEGLGAPPVRPDIWPVPILEWAAFGGILAWTALAAWSWGRAR